MDRVSFAYIWWLICLLAHPICEPARSDGHSVRSKRQSRAPRADVAGRKHHCAYKHRLNPAHTGPVNRPPALQPCCTERAVLK